MIKKKKKQEQTNKQTKNPEKLPFGIKIDRYDELLQTCRSENDRPEYKLKLN